MGTRAPDLYRIKVTTVGFTITYKIRGLPKYAEVMQDILLVGCVVGWKSENGMSGNSLHQAVCRVDDQQVESQAGEGS